MNGIDSILLRTGLYATPFFLATLGEILTERAGILNLGVEGLVSIGALAAFVVGQHTHSLPLAILASLLTGGGLAFIHAFSTVQLRANQTVSGLALTMVGTGLTGFWGQGFVGQACSIRVSPIYLPLLSKIPLLGPLCFSQDIFFYMALVLGLSLWFFLRHTRAGIRVRSVGENPKASEAQGVRVAPLRMACVAVGGALGGLAGAQLSLSYSPSWVENISAGRGWIVVGLTIFSLWNPLRAFGGALLFGLIFILQFRLQPLGIPANILGMLPYLCTLAVLTIDGLRKSDRAVYAPAALSEPYKREER